MAFSQVFSFFKMHFKIHYATKATTCYAGGKGKALARKEVTK
jgi:hypothetical protein